MGSGSGDRAAVDVGTNSIRLLVVDADGRQLTRRMTITRLGRGVDELGRLDDDALKATIEQLRSFRAEWERRGVPAERVRIAATSAVRDAADRDRFFDAVREVTGGLRAEVLTGEQEAALAFSGATAALSVDRPTAVVDIGGGSTEFIVGDDAGEPVASVSVQLGSVRITERLLPDDPPTDVQQAAARREITRRLEEVDERLAAHGAAVGEAATLVGVAGSVTTLAALHLGLDRYEPERIHATAVPAPAVGAWAERLLAMPAAERAELGPMADGREDVIAGGVLIAAVAVQRYGFDELVASEADHLDGLAADRP